MSLIGKEGGLIEGVGKREGKFWRQVIFIYFPQSFIYLLKKIKALKIREGAGGGNKYTKVI